MSYILDNFNKKYITIFLWIVSLQALGFTIGQLTGGGSSDWYRTIVRSSLTPPNIVFPIVWTILYVMIAIAGWKLFEGFLSSNKGINNSRLFYLVQLSLNFIWSPVFFNLHYTGIALIIIFAMIFFVSLTMYYSNDRLVRYMLMPYLVWICFASYLNGFIYFNN